MKKLVTIITGPTASGKSSLAFDYAQRKNLAIISADSRQVYKMMDVGTAKPSTNELSTVRHHLLDFLQPDESYSAGKFARESMAIIQKEFKEKNEVIVCGGTGFYIKALLNGLDDIPMVSPEIRQQLNDEWDAGATTELQVELTSVDSQTANRIDIENKERVLRALEVYRQTGKPLSYYQQGNPAQFPYPVRQLAINWSREKLYQRINQRVDQMLDNGLIDEVKSLEKYWDDQPIKTVGYAEIIKYLTGEWKLDFAIDKIKQHSRNYAKRQLTWCRGIEGLKWISSTASID